MISSTSFLASASSVGRKFAHGAVQVALQPPNLPVKRITYFCQLHTVVSPMVLIATKSFL